MADVIVVYDVGVDVKENKIDEKQRVNIEKIFDVLVKEAHLVTNCYLNTESDIYMESPIYYFYNCEDKNKFDFKRIAEDLLKAECKADNTRNSTISEGLLFIKSNASSVVIMKLEKLTVIDIHTYEMKSELGKEKNYFKVCIFNGDYKDIRIIDKNRTAAKYWYQKFLKLERKRDSESNTKDIIDLIRQDKLYKENIRTRENYKEIKRYTECYLFNNEKFDKTLLFNELNTTRLVELKTEADLFSLESEHVDADFYISGEVLNKKYRKKIKISNEMTIVTNNYLESIRDEVLSFDKKNKKITIMIKDEYLDQVEEQLKDEY